MSYLSSLTAEKLRALAALPSFRHSTTRASDDASLTHMHSRSADANFSVEARGQEFHRSREEEVLAFRRQVLDEQKRADTARIMALHAEEQFHSTTADLRVALENSENELMSFRREVQQKEDVILSLQQEVERLKTELTLSKQEQERLRKEKDSLRAFLENHLRSSAEIEARQELKISDTTRWAMETQAHSSAIESKLRVLEEENAREFNYRRKLEDTVLRLEARQEQMAAIDGGDEDSLRRRTMLPKPDVEQNQKKKYLGSSTAVNNSNILKQSMLSTTPKRPLKELLRFESSSLTDAHADSYLAERRRKKIEAIVGEL